MRRRTSSSQRTTAQHLALALDLDLALALTLAPTRNYEVTKG